MPRRVLTILAALLLAVVLTGAAPAAAGTGAGHARADAEVHVLHLTALNGSGVRATVVLVRRGGELTVVVTARGLTPSQVHMQHVHGLAGTTNASCPPTSADTNGDGIVSLAEGLPFYGPVLLPLTRPDGAYPTARKTGTEVFTERYTVSGDLRDLRDEVVVLHGMVVKGAYDMTVPVACGEIS